MWNEPKWGWGVFWLAVWVGMGFSLASNSRPITHKNPERVPMDFSDLFERSPKSPNIEDRRPEYKPSGRRPL